MKKKIAIVALFVALVAMSVGGTLAYFTADTTATNVITAGNIEIDLVEMEKTENGELVPFENKDGVMPGDVISKIVTVVNTGDNPAYIRIQMEKAITLAEGKNGDIDPSLVSCNINTADWTEKDGYFYYNKPLAAGEETTPLFNEVTFSSKMDNLYQGCKAEIDVFAQAVQVANNGASALEAAGWPEN